MSEKLKIFNGQVITPQGILKYRLSTGTASDPMKMMSEARALLEAIALEPVAA